MTPARRMILRALLPAILLACTIVAGTPARAAPFSETREAGTVYPLPPARTAYLLGCGGCHGETGRSSPAIVPDLASQVGFFLCSPQGRDYLVRLPNVAFAHLSTEDLTRLMNFIVFSLGGTSAPRNAAPYTAAEVERLRHEPLQAGNFMAYRQQVIAGVVKTCPQAAHYSSFATDSPYLTSNTH